MALSENILLLCQQPTDTLRAVKNKANLRNIKAPGII